MTSSLAKGVIPSEAREVRRRTRSLAALGMTRFWDGLSALERRLAFFHEGAAAFLEIFTVEAGFGHLLELLVVLRGFRLCDLAGGGFRECDRERRVLGDGIGGLGDQRIELGVGSDTVHQAHLIGLLGGV